MSDADSDDLEQPVTFTLFGVYRMFGKGQSRLLRFLGEDFSEGELIFKKVAVDWDKVEKVAVAIPRTEVSELVRRVLLVECPGLVRPVYLAYSDEELLQWTKNTPASASKWIARRDSSFEVIRPLVTVENMEDFVILQARLVQTYSPRHFSASVAARSNELGVSELSVKRLLHKYAWFGLEKNGLLSLDSSKGVTGPLVRRYKFKPGQKSAAEKVFGPKHRGTARSPADLAAIAHALEVDYVGNHLSLKKTFDSATKRSGLMLNLTQFMTAARTLRARLGIDARRMGPIAGAKHKKARGRDSDVAPMVVPCMTWTARRSIASWCRSSGQRTARRSMWGQPQFFSCSIE